MAWEGPGFGMHGRGALLWDTADRALLAFAGLWALRYGGRMSGEWQLELSQLSLYGDRRLDTRDPLRCAMLARQARWRLVDYLADVYWDEEGGTLQGTYHELPPVTETAADDWPVPTRPVTLPGMRPPVVWQLRLFPRWAALEQWSAALAEGTTDAGAWASLAAAYDGGWNARYPSPARLSVKGYNRLPRRLVAGLVDYLAAEALDGARALLGPGQEQTEAEAEAEAEAEILVPSGPPPPSTDDLRAVFDAYMRARLGRDG